MTGMCDLNVNQMQQTFAQTIAAAVILGLASLATAAPSDVNKVLDGFVASVEKSSAATADQKRIVTALVQQLRQTPEDRGAAIIESLRLLHPEFKTGLAALGEDNRGAAIVSFSKLRTSADPYLAAAASFYLSRAYLFDERFEDALPLLADLQGKWADKTASGGEVVFLRGVAEVALLRHEEATASLQRFLIEYPDAPERMRVGAFRQLEQLKLYREGT